MTLKTTASREIGQALWIKDKFDKLKDAYELYKTTQSDDAAREVATKLAEIAAGMSVGHLAKAGIKAFQTTGLGSYYSAILKDLPFNEYLRRQQNWQNAGDLAAGQITDAFLEWARDQANERGFLDPAFSFYDELSDGISISLNDWIESGEWMDYVFAFDEAGIHLDFAKKATQGSIARMDPLAFDLGGFHGIDTTGKDNGVLFDHNADGVKNGTGWVREYDAWLALDKDGNGSIDSGRELFGVDTIKRDGHFAQNGFDALADWDVNADGVIDAQDEIFTELRLWRDLNQDGISQSEELLTLSDLNIASINLQNKKENTNLDGTGNVQSATGSYTRTDGSTGLVGNLEVVADSFYRAFTTRITLTEQAKALPTLQGAGFTSNTLRPTFLSCFSH
jgi:hypothetical protein